MDWIDSQYIVRVSGRLQRFVKKSPTSYNFRCPLCGDSKKSKKKARGWFYFMKGHTNFRCYNCETHISLHNFFKLVDPVLADEYQFERLKRRTSAPLPQGPTYIVSPPPAARRTRRSGNAAGPSPGRSPSSTPS